MTVKKSDIAEAVAAASTKGAGEQNQQLSGVNTGGIVGGEHSAAGYPSMGDTLQIGAHICIRTVTIACVGRVERISHIGSNTFLHLSGYKWIADFGEFKQALKTGKLKQFEDLPGIVAVPVAPIVDIHPWDHPL